MLRIICYCAFVLFLSGCKNGEGDVEKKLPETLSTEYNENEMDKAIEKARSSVDDFIKVLESGRADSFSVKAPVSDENGVEHFWVVDVSYTNGVFKGKIGNDPGIVKNVRFGDDWEIKRDEISDWMYRRGDHIHGGYTMEVLLDDMPEDQAKALRSMLVR